MVLIKAQKEVFSSVLGNHITKHKGDGYDFAELRPYETGDDIKHIDWIISSKLDKPHVKVFFQQKELNVTIVPILTGSLHFGTKRLKQEVLTEITALIAFSSVKQGDPYSAYIANENFSLVSQKNKQLFGVRHLVQTVLEYDTIGKDVDYKKLVNNLYTMIKQKSMIFLIGDFFNTKHLNLKALSLKHEIVIIIVRERFEENPPKLNNLMITDPINKKTADIRPSNQALDNYRKKLQEEEKEFFQKLKKSDIRFTKIYNDESPANKIFNLMSRR